MIPLVKFFFISGIFFAYGFYPTDGILPPLTRFCMVCYVTVGSASLTHGCVLITAIAVLRG